MIWAMLVIALLPGCGTNKQVVDAPLRSADPRWAGVDSLMSIGQYATALEGTERILQEATTPEDWRARFKAYLLRGQLKQMTGTDAYAVLAELERTTDSLQAAGNEVPLVPLLHSVLAEGWWNTYQQDRWRILERTNLEDNAADPATWSQRAFMARVLLHAQASLQPRDSLLRIPTGDLGELLRFDPNLPSTQQRTGIALRPTVFDVVGHRAVALFANSETRLAEPAWRFRLDDPRHFALFEEFVYKPLRHRDSTAWEFQALRLQQQLELAHMSDDRPPMRWWMPSYRASPMYMPTVCSRDKDSLYLAALEKLRTRVPEDSCWSEVTTVIAQWHHEQSVKYDRLAGDAWKNEKRTARDLCNEAIATFPGSFGAQQAAALKFALEQPAVNVQCETATPPDQAFKVAVRYTNTSRVWLRVVKDPEELGRERRWDHDHGLWLTQQKPLREWSVDLPEDGDLNEHLAELPIDALPLGPLFHPDQQCRGIHREARCDRPCTRAGHAPQLGGASRAQRVGSGGPGPLDRCAATRRESDPLRGQPACAGIGAHGRVDHRCGGTAFAETAWCERPLSRSAWSKGRINGPRATAMHGGAVNKASPTRCAPSSSRTARSTGPARKSSSRASFR